MAFTYQIGGLAYDSGYSAAMYSPANKTTGMNWHKDILNAWSADNASSNIPRLQYEDKDQNGMSDRFLTDASYLNLQNINFGYTLPSNFTKRSESRRCASTLPARMSGTGPNVRDSIPATPIRDRRARPPIRP